MRWMDGCNGCFTDCCIKIDERMNGCFKDCCGKMVKRWMDVMAILRIVMKRISTMATIATMDVLVICFELFKVPNCRLGTH